MPSVPVIFFALCLLLSYYLTRLCSTPPNPNPDDSKLWKQDRVSFIARRQSFRPIFGLLMHLQHVLIVLYLPLDKPAALHSKGICRHPSNLNPSLFTWNLYSSTCLFLIICVGAPLRLAAFNRLGRNFTFQLAQPDQLITTGIYHYLQHPSYAGLFVLLFPNLLLLLRWDGAWGCWIPPSFIACVKGFGPLVFTAIFVMLASMARARIQDEETMLQEKFGKQWEQWHRSTKRLIPGIF